MKKTKLGEFEEPMLMTVVLQQEAYGAEIRRELEQRLKKEQLVPKGIGGIISVLPEQEP